MLKKGCRMKMNDYLCKIKLADRHFFMMFFKKMQQGFGNPLKFLLM